MGPDKTGIYHQKTIMQGCGGAGKSESIQSTEKSDGRYQWGTETLESVQRG